MVKFVPVKVPPTKLSAMILEKSPLVPLTVLAFRVVNVPVVPFKVVEVTVVNEPVSASSESLVTLPDTVIDEADALPNVDFEAVRFVVVVVPETVAVVMFAVLAVKVPYTVNSPTAI